MGADADDEVTEALDDIWANYDVDDSGGLDKDEVYQFVKDSGGKFTDKEFAEFFKTFDYDNSGTIEKDEMVTFIK